jgi:integrase
MSENLIRRQRRKSLTDAMVAALPRSPKRYTRADPEQRSHYLRIPPQGPVTYHTAARDPYGKLVWSQNGTADLLKIEESREITRAKIKRIKAGLPASEPLPPRPDSFKSVAESWLKRYVAKQGLRSQREIERCLRVYVYPHWVDRAFTTIGRSDLAKLKDNIEDHHGARTADLVGSYLSTIGNWYGERSDDYINPFLRHKRRVPKGAGKRSRMLNDDELRRLWAACEKADSFGRFVMLLLLTAQRRGALARMRWRDLDGDVWHMPREPREKGNGGVLKLPPIALEIIRAQPKLAGDDRVFWMFRNETSSLAEPKSRLDKNCGLSGWVLHDARRTARSLMSRAGVPSEHAERVLGHVIPGIEQIYDRHEYFEEKGAALAKLEQLIKQIVHGEPGGNVLPMQPPAKKRAPAAARP